MPALHRSQPPAKIFITGLPKTGTTALFWKIQHALGNTHHLFFEPGHEQNRTNDHDAITRSSTALVKEIFDHTMLPLSTYEQFDKKIVIIRDPRDRAISDALYSLAERRTHRTLNQKNIHHYRSILNVLRNKRRFPRHQPFVSLVKSAASHGWPDDTDTQNHYKSSVYAVHAYERLIDLIKQRTDFFILRYEDLVAGNIEELERYLGLSLERDTDVHHTVSRVVRTKSHGAWKHWFTPADTSLLSSSYAPILSALGYPPDWRTHRLPYIPKEHCDGYIVRLWNTWTFFDNAEARDVLHHHLTDHPSRKERTADMIREPIARAVAAARSTMHTPNPRTYKRFQNEYANAVAHPVHQE